MDFTYIEDGIDAIVIDNFYTEAQLAYIHKELEWITKPSIMVGGDKLAAAVDYSGKIVTSKSGIFLEEVFNNWRHSALMSSLVEVMDTKEFKDTLVSKNALFKSLLACNSRTHLLSYYENSDYYEPHIDSAFFTMLSYFNKEPKQFTGGEIILKSCNSNKEATVDIVNNRVVIIASCTVHSVKPIVSSMTNSFSGNGRYCNAAFLSVKDQHREQPK